jgi:hypothetical protein
MMVLIYLIFGTILVVAAAGPAAGVTVVLKDGADDSPLAGFVVDAYVNNLDIPASSLRGITDSNGRWEVALSRFRGWDNSRHRVVRLEVHEQIDAEGPEYYEYWEDHTDRPGVFTEYVRGGSHWGSRGTARWGGYHDTDVVVLTLYRIGTGKIPHAGIIGENSDGDRRRVERRGGAGNRYWQEEYFNDDNDPDDDNDGLPDWEDKDQFGTSHRGSPAKPLPPGHPEPHRSLSSSGRSAGTASAPFSLKRSANLEILWPNGRAAVRAEVKHTKLHRAEQPTGYGLWLVVYMLNDKGYGNCFNGAHYILIGRPESGDLLIQNNRPYEIDCGDLLLTYRFRNVEWTPHDVAGWSGRFSGEVVLEARMEVDAETGR